MLQTYYNSRFYKYDFVRKTYFSVFLFVMQFGMIIYLLMFLNKDKIRIDHSMRCIIILASFETCMALYSLFPYVSFEDRVYQRTIRELLIEELHNRPRILIKYLK